MRSQSALQAIRKNPESRVLFWDLFMLVLILVNLSLISFQWIYNSAAVQGFFARNLPAFHSWYMESIFEDFLLIDMGFVLIYMAELFVRWGIAIYRKTYHKWFFYPFVHWYDTLGCIPLGSFRFLRILRVFSMLYRLQRMGIIDLKKTYAYQWSHKYLNILAEEVSDRVVVNVLDGVERQVKSGNPLGQKIVKEALQPRQQELTEWLTHRIQLAVANSYARFQPEARTYIEGVIAKAVDENAELARIEKVPMLGKPVAGMIEAAIQDIVLGVMEQLIEDATHREDSAWIHELAEIFIGTVIQEEAEQEQPLSQMAKDTAVHVLDLVKEEIKVQQWKLAENA